MFRLWGHSLAFVLFFISQACVSGQNGPYFGRAPGGKMQYRLAITDSVGGHQLSARLKIKSVPMDPEDRYPWLRGG